MQGKMYEKPVLMYKECIGGLLEALWQKRTNRSRRSPNGRARNAVAAGTAASRR